MSENAPHDPEMADRQTTIRMPKPIAERIERLQAAMAQQPEFRAFTVSQAAVIRAVMEAGLDALEKRYGVTHAPEARQ